MTKAQAERGAQALRRKLKGKGWKIKLWENMGWHYCLQLGPLRVDRDRSDGFYSVLMGEKQEDNVGGSYLWLVRAGFLDPNCAVTMQIRKARKTVDRLNALVNSVEDALK